jgi:hypothetical protein
MTMDWLYRRWVGTGGPARTYQFAGYVKGGGQTLLLQQENVSGPGVRP